MESPQPTNPDRESTDESLNLQIENPADKTFLRKVNTEYKKQDNNVSVHSRMTMGVEIPILVLSSINVSALVVPLHKRYNGSRGKAISLGLTTLSHTSRYEETTRSEENGRSYRPSAINFRY